MIRSQTLSDSPDVLDLVVIGGGINGCGIARDAVGRGLSVLLAEQGDLAGATSSASTKLFHGGLRYLEYFEFRLVREALIEREVLLRAMPHIAWPMRFVLPYHKAMRFDAETPTSRLLGWVMPWMKGRRPAWLIRLGLFLYDNLGGRKILPGTEKLDLQHVPEGGPLKEIFRTAYEYSDCWVQDSRLVALNARDAAARGVEVLTRTKVTEARVEEGVWTVTLSNGRSVKARALVNAAGPWAGDVIKGVLHRNTKDHVRLVRGSHIVTAKLFDHEKAYFFQGKDGRIIFAIPYEQEFTLIGTTDAEHSDPDVKPRCSEQERDYLCAFASEYFKRPVSPDDVVWTYSGVRPLYDDGARSATAATRDYVLVLDTGAGAPVLNVFGGKITTYRRLAESALEKLGAHLPMSGDWTAGVPLPGGDFPVDGVADLIADLRARHLFLTAPWAKRLVRSYGTEAAALLQGAEHAADLGEDFGATLSAREVDWLIAKEWARSAEDILWRRTKLGLHLDAGQVALLEAYVSAHVTLT
ncbi:glycerol-3-phosphate dehydrogenase [Pararhodobacter zhoushanensis]|uniref:Glycerol-3-phosphate dehydrogenase n=1 Tax=Pararhodobacter zhoushanensis TaxID=2479545 RepID=A0ABT3GZL4_9RHOB|nr:glycerol-3-phosphate dehydrogenase [Pararhodobacter zhoushanensis]MCW1932961.1 glycerol-3-phosphate dehydrogenase [Pararhodobacter zhoushanensis]